MDHCENIIRKKNPRKTANIISFLTFAYTVPLFKNALKEDLVERDIYEVLDNCESKKSGDLLEKEWEIEFKKDSPSMARLMWKRWGWKYISMGCIDLVWRTIRSVLDPYALSSLISYFKPGQTIITKNEAYYYAGLVLFLHIAHCVFLHNYVMWGQGLAIEIKAAFSSLIYRKALKLTPAVLSEITLGNIVTLITKDAFTFRMSIWIINDIWTGILQVIIVCYLLYSKIGVVSFAGIAVLVLSIPLQVYLGKLVATLKLQTGEKTDERLQATQETLNSIRIIKMYTWEPFFNERINIARCKEMAKLLLVSYLKMIIILVGMIFSKAGFYILLTVYIYLGYASDTTLIFYILANFNDLKATLGNSIPNRIGKFGEFLSSFKRISTVLNSKEMEMKLQKTEPTSNPVIDINNAGVQIGNIEILKNISIHITTGLTAVTGKVGSGKSSLLKMLVQDYTLKSGNFTRQGDISYASQDPWLFPSTIKQNILFGQPFNEKRYNEVLKVCALDYDLNLFLQRDETVLCDRGANLSKGQQARINLARAVYKESDIYLLDDSLTSLDQTIQNYIFNECIKTFLKNKIVVFVTQTADHLLKADTIIFMKNGQICDSGKPKDLINHIENGTYENTLEKDEKDCFTREDDYESDETHKLLECDKFERCKPVYGEMQNKGRVNLDVYKQYFIFGGGFLLALFNVTLGGVTQYSESYSDKLLTSWVDKQQCVLTIQNNLSHLLNNTLTYDVILNNISNSLDTAKAQESNTFKWYTVMIIASAILDLVKTYLMFDFCRRASVKLHKTIVHKIINAVMTFFDNNFIGNILNRFSQDMVNIDENIPQSLSECYRVIFSAAGTVILISTINTSFLLYSAIIFTMLIILRYLYLPAGRSLKRLDASTRSPMIGHLNASLEGLTTIRACGMEEKLSQEFDRYQNLHTSAHYMSACTIRAFGFFMDFLCSTFMVVVITRFIFMDTETTAGNVGLALTQVMLLGNTVQWGTREWSELENLMTSVERVLEYTNIRTERSQGAIIDNWPRKGAISFKDVTLSYNDKETVLKKMSFEVNPGEKIGIVGRTGAGKSSIIASLFRLYQTEGKILIDGVNIRTLDLDFLRKGLAIIPQDPVIFSGTIRSNLDPFNEYKDDDLWDALNKVNMKNLVSGLDQIVSNNSLGMSSGQKQMICLARVMLRKCKIICLDEPSSNMDHETDILLHHTIKSNFSKSTMFIVAHRLHSILDCDRIMVVHQGKLVEFDTPSNLLLNTNGFFYKVVKNARLLNYNLKK